MGLLLPKLRRHFAEFLQHRSLKRLGILYQSTCVGFGLIRFAAATRLSEIFVDVIDSQLNRCDFLGFFVGDFGFELLLQRHH